MEGQARRHAVTLGGVQFALLVAHYLIKFINTTTLDAVKYSGAWSAANLAVMAALLLVALAVTARALLDGGRAAFGLALLRVALAVGTVTAVFRNPSSVEPWLLAVTASTCVEQEERRLFGTGFRLGAAIVVAVFALSMLDIIENNRGSGFGFIYRTHYACHLLCLALGYCLWKDGKLSWRGELGLVALLLFNARFVQGKTLTACLLLLILATFLRHYRHVGGAPFQDRERYGVLIPLLFKLLYLPVALLNRLLRLRDGRRLFAALAWSFVFCAALMIACSAGYRAIKPVTDHIRGFSTVKQRLMLGMVGFEHFPIRLFGSHIPQWGLSGSEGSIDLYYAIDSGYVKLLLEYGLLPFLAILGLMTWAQLRLLRAKRRYAVLLLTIFALDGLMDYWIISMAYNLFILLASCRLQSPPSWEDYDRAERDRPAVSPGKRRLRGLALAACAAAFGLWCATAYPISTWSGWTPSANATLVVPGDFMDGVSTQATRAARLEAARQYLEDDPGARCVLSGSEPETAAMAAWLVERGIDAERLHVDAGVDSVDAMLESARTMISDQALPPRLTVCTFRMQQARVARIARKAGVPVNALGVDMPWQVYLPNYFAEQWKILQ